MKKLVSFFLIILFFSLEIIAMEKKPYHHLPDGTFRNPEGSPKRDSNVKWSYKIFNEERKKVKIEIPEDHIVPKKKVLEDLKSNQDKDYIAWIGHATFLIKLGNTTIITDPVFSKNTGPLIFGPKRYVPPAINLDEIPPVDLFLLTHNHYDHQDMSTIRNFPYKKSKVVLPLKLGKYFRNYKDVNELDWYQEIQVNEDIKVTLLPAVHWSRRGLWDINKTLWGNFLIEYKGKKILFACDTGYGNIYKELGEKYNQLIKEIYTRQGSILIFVKTRRNAEKMVKRLKYDDHDADAIHGNLRQNKRDRVIKAFRNNHFRILVGTDVASRGLDIPAIKHVINFDLPQVPEDFIHRIGRTARAGAEGSALSFVGGEDRSKWNAIQRLIDPNFRAEPGSEATGRRKRGGRSFDRRGRRGGSRFKKRDDRNDRGSRDERPGSRFKKNFTNKKSSFKKKRFKD
ncbi:helicase-related protein [Pelagibacteraceae bacterium]|nr:helicase-related protein [Pelagibacteraceae bacterium]